MSKLSAATKKAVKKSRTAASGNITAKEKRGRLSRLVMLITVSAGILISFCAICFYLDFVNDTIFSESSRNLLETFGQVNRNFSSMVSKNNKLLSEWSSHIDLYINSGQINRLEQELSESRLRWGYTDLYFIDDSGEYFTLSDEKGSLESGAQIMEYTREDQNTVLNVMLSDGKNMTFFIVPLEESTIKGFRYNAIALGYNKSDLARGLDISVFGDSAEIFVLYPDGSVAFTGNDINDYPKNYLEYIKNNAHIDLYSLKSLTDAVENGKECVVECGIGGEEQYITCIPVGFQEWSLFSIVPKRAVNLNMLKLQWGAVLVSLVILMILVGAMSLIRLSRREIHDKDVELKYRDKIFDILFENSSNIFIIFKPVSFEVEYVSPNAEKLLGVPGKDVINAIRFPDSDNRRSEGIWDDNVISSVPLGSMIQQERERIIGKTGERLWYKETIYHEKIEDNEVYILIMSDRTNEKFTAEQMLQAMEIANSANAAKSNFLANMSHDIRTPINTIMGLTILLGRDSDKPDRILDYKEKMSTAGSQLLDMINSVLDMSKIESGKTSLNNSSFEIYQLLNEVGEVIQPQADAKHQSFEVRGDSLCGRWYYADKQRITQILLNLLSNSVKYTDTNGKILLTAEIGEYDVTSDTIVFTVEDNGIGMSSEYIKHIFEPFSREEKSAEIKGTGLGMAIVKRLVDLMGGVISVESEQGKGSCFVVELPLRRCSDDMSDDHDSSKNSSNDSISGMRFLVAEDIEINADILNELLIMYGATADIAENGERALELFSNSEKGYYNAVLMDIRMPVMDGYEAARAIRACAHPDAASVPIIAMTANAYSDDVKKCLDAGMNAHLAKPVNIGLLAKMLHKIISSEDTEIVS